MPVPSAYAGWSRDARMKAGVLDLSLGSGGIWTKWRSSDAEVPTYRLPSACAVEAL